MSTQKRALASASSCQPSQPKRQCVGSSNQTMDSSENILTPKTCPTLEDFQRVVDSAVQRLESILECFNENWKRSLEEVEKRVEALEHAQVHSTCLGRPYGKSGETNDARILQLHFRTNLSPTLYTGRKLEGENRDSIHVALIDANTGDVVSSAPESSIKLDAFVLDGDFNKDDNDDWTQEEFENNVVKGRERKGPLLTGNCRVVLKEGVGVLGDLIFNDNSNWNCPSQKFRLGLKVASGYCKNARIREAITEAFHVKENRGKASEKKHPPAPDDELWRLEKIAKDGKPLRRLNDAGIHKVEDFLLELSRDPENLRNILGMKEKHWKILLDHARTCARSGELDVYSQDDTRNHGAVLKNTDQLSGLIENGAYIASRRLSTFEKEYGDPMLKKASDNWNRVEEFHGEASFASIQDKHSGSLPSGVIGGQTEILNPVEHNPPLVCVNAVGGEPPGPFVQSTSEGNDGITAVGFSIQSQNFSLQGSLKQSQNVSLQTVELAGPPCLLPSSFNDISGNSPSEGDSWIDRLLISFPNDDSERNSRSSFTSMPNADNYTEDSFGDTFICTPPYDGKSSERTVKAVVGWLKIKAAMRWGLFIRKRTLRIVELVEGEN